MNLVLVGAGGHGKSCASVIESTEDIVKGFLDSHLPAGSIVAGYPVLGGDEMIAELIELGDGFHVAVGTVGQSALRVALFESLVEKGGILPSIVSKWALIDRNASIGNGTILMHRATVNRGATVGRNCIINTGALIEHDSMIGDHCHISTGSLVNGNCTIGSHVFIGSGSVLKQGVSIANGVVVGAGAVVVNDLVHSGVYFGCPARRKE